MERRLPDTVVVNVREWEPRYLVRLEGRLYYMTPEAHVVDAPLDSGLDYPVVTGLGWVQFDAPGPHAGGQPQRLERILRGVS